MTQVLVIDSGHGKSDPGAIAIDGIYEKEYTLALGLAVRDALAVYDCEVIMTRESDVAVELGERAQIANRAKADLFLSLHHDSASNPGARGGSLYIHTDLRTDSGGLRWLPADGNHISPTSHAIAKAFIPPVRLALNESYGIPWRDFGDKDGISCADFAVLRYCRDEEDGKHIDRTPAILLESHFGSNEHDNWASRQPTFIRDIATAIAQGLANALELTSRVVAPQAPAKPSTEAAGTPILGDAVATVEQAMAWFEKKTGMKLTTQI